MNRIWTSALTMIFAGMSLTLAVGACSVPKTGEHAAGENSHSKTHGEPAANASGFSAEVTTNPARPVAGADTEIILTVKDPSGATVRDLAIVHEKPMHLIVVSSDLSEFYHIHPEPQADGTYRVKETFPFGGEYKLYVDFKPASGAATVEKTSLKVEGSPRTAVALVADSTSTKSVDGLKVTMKPDGPLSSGVDRTLNFTVRDEKSGAPVTNLEKYLGEYAHFVIISEDGADFLHAHPMAGGSEMAGMDHGGATHKDPPGAEPHQHGPTPGKAAGKSPSEVMAHTNFPRPGLYKIWAQFQRSGKVISVPFIVRIEAGAQAASAEMPSDAVKVSVTASGYEPSQISVKADMPVRLAFTRTTAEGCGGKVVFPGLGIEKDLPVGQTVLVEFTPKAAGDVGFQCGMGMYRGKLVVN